MPNFGYSVFGLDPARTAKGSGRDLRISPKHAREICHSIKGKMLVEAKEFLEAVIDMKQMVPYKRYNKLRAHHRGLHKWYAGGYPEKAARAILKVLDNVEGIASYKGLDTDSLRIIHAAAQRGRIIKRAMPRAFGRTSPKYRNLTHVEIVLEEERISVEE
nr:50S ribosomal protein L22 [Candidatus Freyarchaeota archaeon]